MSGVLVTGRKRFPATEMVSESGNRVPVRWGKSREQLHRVLGCVGHPRMMSFEVRGRVKQALIPRMNGAKSLIFGALCEL